MLSNQTHKSEILPSIKYKSSGNFTPKLVPWYAGYFKLKALEIQQRLEEAPFWYSVIYHRTRPAKEKTIAFHPLSEIPFIIRLISVSEVQLFSLIIIYLPSKELPTFLTPPPHEEEHIRICTSLSYCLITFLYSPMLIHINTIVHLFSY